LSVEMTSYRPLLPLTIRFNTWEDSDMTEPRGPELEGTARPG